MRSHCLLDTNICVTIVNDRPAAVRGRFASAAVSDIGPNDLWIAAHARAAGLVLVSNNEREFKRVPGLKVENWARA